MRPGIPTYLPHRQERNDAREARKKVVVAAWQLVSARGVGQSTLALLRLVIARGCEQKGDKEWMLERERTRARVCVWVSLVGGLSKGKARQRYLKKLEEGGSRYARREPSKYATS